MKNLRPCQAKLVRPYLKNKTQIKAGWWWLTAVVLVTWEVESGMNVVWGVELARLISTNSWAWWCMPINPS
jgi:hypothetical protein